MRKDTLSRRFAGLNRPATVSIRLPVQTLLRVEGIAKQQGMSRKEAVQEAVRDWSVARERSLNRRRRLELTKAMREAADQKPIAELLERFRAQMESVGEEPSRPEDKVCDQGLTDTAGSGRTDGMGTNTEKTLRQRREALGLSRERLARVADISTSMVAQLEEGRRPAASKALPALEAALRQQERIAA